MIVPVSTFAAAGKHRSREQERERKEEVGRRGIGSRNRDGRYKDRGNVLTKATVGSRAGEGEEKDVERAWEKGKNRTGKGSRKDVDNCRQAAHNVGVVPPALIIPLRRLSLVRVRDSAAAATGESRTGLRRSTCRGVADNIPNSRVITRTHSAGWWVSEDPSANATSAGRGEGGDTGSQLARAEAALLRVGTSHRLKGRRQRVLQTVRRHLCDAKVQGAARAPEQHYAAGGEGWWPQRGRGGGRSPSGDGGESDDLRAGFNAKTVQIRTLGQERVLWIWVRKIDGMARKSEGLGEEEWEDGDVAASLDAEERMLPAAPMRLD
ncbi:hypothetical protein C8F04DRAFT_1299216 [Mycena alexandri]|uniref:Uncharacterized protein n=1 Tax=Mycena alexandri TaxID=1745969 RepID=A0AAD6T917_9AGAR|nr:hypothetical protein C8F04DRAFT_1299216 [Mycena alexandri]